MHCWTNLLIGAMCGKLFPSTFILILDKFFSWSLDELHPFYQLTINIFAFIIIFTLATIIAKSMQSCNKHSTGPGGAHTLTFKGFPPLPLRFTLATV